VLALVFGMTNAATAHDEPEDDTGEDTTDDATDPEDDTDEDTTDDESDPEDDTAEDTTVHPIVFPVDADHQFINDWHYPRDGGARLHEGTDIIAERHSPLVATVDGVIATVRHSNSGRSGNMVVLDGDDGHRYYYIHLNNDEPGTDNNVNLYEQAFATGIAKGVRVAAGDTIGFVGDSGNAEATTPHLHFGIASTAGEALNPFWSLSRADLLGQTSALTLTQLPATGPRGSALLGYGLALFLAGALLLGASTMLRRLRSTI